MATSGVRLNEVLVAISMATDLGLGQPSEHMVRSARLSMRLGDRLRLDSSQLAVLYDVSLLTYVGCPVFGNEAALVFGDDIDFRSGTYDVDLRSRDGMRYNLGIYRRIALFVDEVANVINQPLIEILHVLDGGELVDGILPLFQHRTQAGRCR